MLHRNLSTLILFVLVLALPISVNAQEQPDPPAKLDFIDIQVVDFLEDVATFQAQYFADNGKYFQGLSSHTTPPDDALLAPDNLDSHPDDQTAPLSLLWDSLDLPTSINWSFRISTYDGPDGAGYVVIITTKNDGHEWISAHNFGPEDWRGFDWVEIVLLEF